MQETQVRPRFGALSSWMDPDQLSLTVISVGKVFIGLVTFFAVSKGLDPAQAQSNAQAVIDLIAQAIPLAFSLWHLMNGIWGGIQKFIVYFFENRSQ